MIRRRSTSVRARRGRGFTVLELLLALVIATMILTAASSVLVTTLDAWKRGSDAWSESQAADRVGALIERHLRAALSPAIDGDAVFRGTDLSLDDQQIGHRLTLTSAAGGRFPRNLPLTDVCEIEFEFDPEGEDGFTMRLQCPPDDLPDDGGYLVGLSSLVRGFRVIYYDGEEWVDSWTSNELPAAVEFTLVMDRAGADAEEAGGRGRDAEEEAPVTITRLVWLPASEAKAPEDDSGGAGGGQAEGGQAGSGQAGSGQATAGRTRGGGAEGER